MKPVGKHLDLAPTEAVFRQLARQVRRDIVSTLYTTQGGGHYGGCLSVVEIVLSIYASQLRLFPGFPHDQNRDRFILSKGHAALAYYAVLRRLGLIELDLKEYASVNSRLEGHPDMTATPMVDFSTGSLGQGLSVATGMAIGLKAKNINTWVVLGDGECQEGQIWEAAMLASRLKLGNLFAVIDCNKYQEWGFTSRLQLPPHTHPLTAISSKWRAFGWFVTECDGHDFDALHRSYRKASACKRRPKVVIAHTIKGKGVPLIEGDPKRFHCTSVSAAEHQQIMRTFQVK